MKTICAVLATALLLALAPSAQAAEYQHFRGPQGWRTGLMEFLQRFKPDPASVTGGFNGEFDVHVYLVPGQFNGTYKLLHMKHATQHASNTIKALLDGGTAKILGFIGDDVYVLTWTKPTS